MLFEIMHFHWDDEARLIWLPARIFCYYILMIEHLVTGHHAHLSVAYAVCLK